ncbi:MAG: alpha-L-fucosidase [Myxococcota bacterium]
MSAYRPSWNSLREHATPAWLREAKFGIYTHWGVYSVPACGPNGTWYPYNMYREGTDQHAHHVATYGPPSAFGYKDFIPMFTAEKFDPDDWAELFKRAGARFAGPVGEHHDGFAMWDSAHTEWNAARMGPQRDVVGELERAIRAQGMRFLVALHHFENWWFFPHWRKEFDTSDPRYAGLYGPPHNLDGQVGDGFFAQAAPSQDFLELWKAKSVEVVDRYRPDVLWFDFGLGRVQEHYRREFLAHYYNRAEEWGTEVAVTYKFHSLPPGTGVIDYELGRMHELTYNDWITDTSVDDQGAWSYVKDAGFKSVTRLVHNLVDNVSKNGYLLLNVGPLPNGEIPAPARERLLGLGEWLDLNGEAIYGTVPWMEYGEGPTRMEAGGMFSERNEVDYTPQDIRFTVKDDVLYATCLGWPGERITVKAGKRLYPSEIRSVRLLGVEKELDWSIGTEGLAVHLPEEKPCEHACVLEITRGRPF